MGEVEGEDAKRDERAMVVLSVGDWGTRVGRGKTGSEEAQSNNTSQIGRDCSQSSGRYDGMVIEGMIISGIEDNIDYQPL